MAIRLKLLTIRAGTTFSGPLDELVLTYLSRCNNAFSASLQTFRTTAALFKAATDGSRHDAAVLWLADGNGQTFSSGQFAERIRRTRDSGIRHLLLAVGPADGWTEDARNQADLRLSLGPMTLPHELAALVLAEQIYRASTILQGHPYHLGH